MYIYTTVCYIVSVYYFSDDEFVGKSSDSDSELERETAQEKRLRIAKEYLNQVEAESNIHYISIY